MIGVMGKKMEYWSNGVMDIGMMEYWSTPALQFLFRFPLLQYSNDRIIDTVKSFMKSRSGTYRKKRETLPL